MEEDTKKAAVTLASALEPHTEELQKWLSVPEDKPISLTAFTTLPQAVRDWIEKDLHLKRLDVRSVHIVHSRPKVVTLETVKQEEYTARFSILKSGMWKKAREK